MEAAGRMRQNRLAGSKRAQRMRLVHRDHIPNLIGVLLAGEMNRKMLRNGRRSRCSTSRISCAGECCSHRQCRCQDGTVGRGGTQTIPVCRTRPLPDKSRFPTVQGKGRNSGKKFGQDRSVRTAPFTPRPPPGAPESAPDTTPESPAIPAHAPAAADNRPSSCCPAPTPARHDETPRQMSVI